jgi:dihydroflavonol-4-reductase
MQSVAVTGASGHIGANLIRALCAQGRHVRALVHADRRAFEGIDIEIIPADVLDPDSLNKAFSGAEVVFHLAATISLRKRDAALMYRVNVEGTRNVVEACRLTGVRRLVHFSSIHALRSDTRSDLIDEKTPLVEKSRSLPYDWTKAEAEKLVR